MNKIFLEKSVLNEDELSKYRCGFCDVFAIALHRMFKYPLYVVRGYYWDNIDKYAV